MIAYLFAGLLVPQLVLESTELSGVYGLQDSRIYLTQWAKPQTFAWPKGAAVESGTQILGVDRHGALVSRDYMGTRHRGVPDNDFGLNDWPRQYEYRMRGSWTLRFSGTDKEPCAVFRDGAFVGEFMGYQGDVFLAISPQDGSVARCKFDGALFASIGQASAGAVRFSRFRRIKFPRNWTVRSCWWRFEFAGVGRLIGVVDLALPHDATHSYLTALDIRSHEGTPLFQLPDFSGDMLDPDPDIFCCTQDAVYFIDNRGLWKLKLPPLSVGLIKPGQTRPLTLKSAR